MTEQRWPYETRSVDFTIDLDRVFGSVVIQVDLTEKREQNFLSELDVFKPARVFFIKHSRNLTNGDKHIFMSIPKCLKFGDTNLGTV